MSPQTELFKLLAESKLRMHHMNGVHQKAIASIPAKQDARIARLNQLREGIWSAGVGRNKTAENQYLSLLEGQRIYDQSYSMGSSSTILDEAIPGELMKTIEYGKMLLDIYSTGDLVKGASADLQAIASQLTAMPFPSAQAIGSSLQVLCNGHNQRSLATIIR